MEISFMMGVGKKGLIALVLLALGFLGTSTPAQASIRLDFVSLTGGGITFDPTDVSPPASGVGSFSFNHGDDNPSTTTNEGNFAFQITNHSGNTTPGTGAKFLLGDITGTYNIGPITTSGNTEEAAIAAGVGATHQFSITDANNAVFLADVNWIKIRTTGVGGTINADGEVNLSNVSYSGSNADLQQLLSEVSPNRGVATISFQLTSSASLAGLTSGSSSTTTSFSGSVSSVPAPSSIVLASLGSVLAGGIALRRRKQFLATGGAA